MTGYGACELESGPATSRKLGEWSERWRFRRLPPEQWKHRERALKVGCPTEDPLSVRGLSYTQDDVDFEVHPDFPEVPCKLLLDTPWKTVLKGKFKGSEHITPLAGSALLLAVRRCTRSSCNHNTRRVFIVDNFGLHNR